MEECEVQPGSAAHTIKPLPLLHCLCTTIVIGFGTAGPLKTLRAEPFGAVVQPGQLQLTRCTAWYQTANGARNAKQDREGVEIVTRLWA